MVDNAKSALTPKLRFPEFRDGPSWKEESMNTAYSFGGNNSLSRDKLNYEHGSIKNIHYGDIHTKFSTHFDVTKEAVPYINASESAQGFRPENDCAEGDMVFADASEDLADVGKAIELVCLNGERVVAGLHTILARPVGDKLAIGFGGHLFKSSRVRAQIQKESQGTKVLGLSATRLSKIRLSLPPTKSEQQKIAECLSTLDELIGAESQKLDALKTHKQGLMQRLFPREGETLPRLRFAEFQSSEEWKEKTLEDLCAAKISYGIVQAGPHVPGGMPYIKSTDLNSALRLEDLSRTSDVIAHKYRRSEVVPGDIVFSLRGNIGTSQIIPPEIPVANLTQGTARMRASGSAGFLLYALRTAPVHRRILALSKGSTFQEVSLEALRTVSLLHPHESEQLRIAGCLASLDALIAARARKIETLTTHKSGLMQQLFPSPVEVEG